MTRSFAIIVVSAAAFKEIADKMMFAGYDDQITFEKDGSMTLDLHGLALKQPGPDEIRENIRKATGE